MIKKFIESGVKDLGLSVPSDVINALELYAQELLKWNRKINLTAITDAKEMAIKHFIDSLYFANCVKSGETVLDIGSGAGMPSIPLKIWKPDVKVVSVDAVSKKIQFQKHAARILGLENFEAIHDRIENLMEKYPNYFDVITSRAFSSLEQFVKLSRPFLSADGRIVAMKGPASEYELAESGTILFDLGFEVSTVTRYDLPQNCGNRSLIVITRRKC